MVTKEQIAEFRKTYGKYTTDEFQIGSQFREAAITLMDLCDIAELYLGYKGVPEVDADIYQATICKTQDLNGQCVFGVIYNDKKRRFDDGYRIQTTHIISRQGFNIIHTKNSIYRLHFEERPPK